MDKQELINKLKATLNKAYDYALDLANQLNEPEHEKVTLPKKVGEIIDAYKNTKQGFDGMIDDAFDHNLIGYVKIAPVTNYINSEPGDVTPVLGDAWRYGWETEKEPVQKFYVRVPKTVDRIYQKAGKTYANKNLKVINWDDHYDKTELCQFTDDEIKKYRLENMDRIPAATR